MGYSISWIATRGIAAEEVQRLLGLRPLAKDERVPDSSCSSGQLESGWHLVVLFEDCDAVNRHAGQLISHAPEAITCFVEEHVMVSGISAWKHGEKAWSVEHESEKGMYHLDIQGTPPDELAGIVASSKAEQEAEGGESAGVDCIFDIPSILAEALIGFRLDGDLDYESQHPLFAIEKKRANAPAPASTSAPASAKKAGCLPLLLLGGAALAGIIVRTTN